MGRTRCWLVEDGRYRPCEAPAREVSAVVCLHTHTCHSVENLASLNWVCELPLMRPFKGLLRWSFGLPADATGMDYRQLCYHPPYRPQDVWLLEMDGARRLGLETLLLAITDHDEVGGAVELLRARPNDALRIGLGEELSFRFKGYVFHLGVSGLPEKSVDVAHASLQASARGGKLDDLFEQARSLGCLIVLNHPLIPWTHGDSVRDLTLSLLQRYGWAIHALELNGMRSEQENQDVMALARSVGKPLVGGGDSHLLVASSALCATEAATFLEFAEEVKSGVSLPLLMPEYFMPHRWKLLLRVLSFIAQYRRIAEFRGEPVSQLLKGSPVLLDPIGLLARAVLGTVGRLGWLA